MPENYVLRDITPKEMRCGVTIACPSIYEITPKGMICIAGACPGIYEAKDVNWEIKNMETGEVLKGHLNKGTHYLIIGELIDPKEIGLENKVGKSETIVKVPKNLLVNIKDSLK